MSGLLRHYPWLGVLLGAAMILWAGGFQAAWDARRRSRLAELEGGAPARYFEERRALQAYPGDGRRPWVWGVACGVVILVSSVAALVIHG
jgi:hypothetical protein